MLTGEALVNCEFGNFKSWFTLDVAINILDKRGGSEGNEPCHVFLAVNFFYKNMGRSQTHRAV